jgi:hypothetical protein
MIKEQRNLKGIREMNKGGKLKQLATHHLMFLKDGLMRDGFKSIFCIHLKHHPIGVDIQNGLNTMDHCFTTTHNHHVKLMRQHVKIKHVTKLST